MLKDKVAIITGASRGIGKAIAELFAEQGARLIVVSSKDQEGLHAVVEYAASRGTQAAICLGDVAQETTAQSALDLAMQQFKRIDILVNCAGIITRTPVERLLEPEWTRVLEVNLTGTFHMCKAVLPHMREQKSGKIISITSQMAKMPHPGASPSYEVSKAGQVALTRHLALHYAPYGVCINAIAPGSIKTGLADSMPEQARKKIEEGIPLKRLGLPREVAQCAVFLASPMSDYITGEVVDVNGGSLMD